MLSGNLQTGYLISLSPVQGDHDEREDADVDAEGLGEGAELAHELGQVPALEERGVELERDAEDGDDHVGRGEVGDVEVGDGVHGAGAGDHHDDQEVAEDGQQADAAVAEREEEDDA